MRPPHRALIRASEFRATACNAALSLKKITKILFSGEKCKKIRRDLNHADPPVTAKAIVKRSQIDRFAAIERGFNAQGV